MRVACPHFVPLPRGADSPFEALMPVRGAGYRSA
ncbi:hypothetical protein BJ989_000931 [Nocardioides perillae]|uniref:Uncharacterized protein n=1 Tax=Nocardioides perillae TaxID=1119534 RepID=A0A7Y9UL39_9ACTN|nr:hypothetical protein [Nocardioides perillae]